MGIVVEGRQGSHLQRCNEGAFLQRWSTESFPDQREVRNGGELEVRRRCPFLGGDGVQMSPPAQVGDVY